MSVELFTFRDVAKRVGADVLDPHQSWALGQQIRRIAADLGHSPIHILSEKTNPEPSVAAPHCIAHYRVEIFEEVVRQVRFDRDGAGQLDLFE